MQDNDVRTVLGLAVADEPPCAAGPEQVFQQAGRMRNRQWLTVSLSGVGAVAVVLAVALAVGTGGHPGQASSTPGLQAGAPGVPSPSPSREVVQVPAEVLSTLESLLPAGLTFSAQDSQQGYAGLVATDSAGKVRIEINVQPDFGKTDRPSSPAASGSTDKPATPGGGAAIDSVPGPGESQSAHAAGKASDPSSCSAWGTPMEGTCVDQQLPDGNRLLTVDGPNLENTEGAVLERVVQIITPDGLRIVLVQWNATDVKHGAATRPNLLLSLDQMKAIVNSPAWVH